MEEKIIMKCPNCGGETKVQGVSFCPFCGNSLLGKAIVANNQSVKEEVNEIEDGNLETIDGTEYPHIFQDAIGLLITMIIYFIFATITFIACGIEFLMDHSDDALMGFIAMPCAMLIFFIIILVLVAKDYDKFRMRRKFRTGNKKMFSAEVRSYNSKEIEGKEKRFIVIKADVDGGVKVFSLSTKNKKRKYYIGETVKVTASNGIFKLEKTEN